MKTGSRSLLVAPALTLALIPALLPSPAAADPVADFYKGKQVKMIIRTAAGGGYDLYARLLMRHMPRHIPGNPSAVNVNMPGGGGLKSANYVARVAPRDGSILTIVSQALPMIQGLKLTNKLQADMKAFNWIGNMSKSNQVFVVWHTSKAKSVEDLKKQTVVIGGTGAGSASIQLPAVYNNVLGTRLKIIYGYESGTEINFAMEKGELEGRGTNPWASWVSATPQLVAKKLIRPLIQVGLEKDPALPDVALLKDLGKTPEETAILTYVSKAVVVGRPIAVAQGVPADRVKALRVAFEATLKDAKFMAEAKKQRADIDPMTGEDLQKLVAELVDVNEDLRLKVLGAIDAKKAAAQQRAGGKKKKKKKKEG
jgi:tripartite-type tricarboxylate transporter receptor subunit TctC